MALDEATQQNSNDVVLRLQGRPVGFEASVALSGLTNLCVEPTGITSPIATRGRKCLGETMKLLRSVLLVTALGVVATPAHAEIAVNEMFQRFSSGTKMVHEFYLTTFQGQYSGLEAANSYLESQKAAKIFCPPKGKTFSGEQIMEMLRVGVASDPDLGKSPVEFAVLRVFQQTYPCRPQSN